MPSLTIAGGVISLPPNCALLDTNVLVARFDVSDGLHDEARLTLEDDNRFEWVVTGPVLVEACGLLARRAGAIAVADLIAWLVTPGNRVYILSCCEGPNEHDARVQEQLGLMEKRGIDFVDAYLMRVASLMAAAFKLPHLPIVTSDSRDFFSGGGYGMKYGVLDLREPGGDVIPIV